MTKHKIGMLLIRKNNQNVLSNGTKNIFFSFADFSFGLRLTEVRIPNHTVRDSSPKLECHFDLDGESLYSVKWWVDCLTIMHLTLFLYDLLHRYKDGNEFYRYVPRDMPPAQVFALPGVTVDVGGFFFVAYRFHFPRHSNASIFYIVAQFNGQCGGFGVREFVNDWTLSM